MESTGTRIRSLAVIVEVLGIILTLFLAISTWVTGCEKEETYKSSYYSYYKEDNDTSSIAGITGVVILIVGGLSSWCSGLVIDGFGELIENSSETRYYIKQLTETQITKKEMKSLTLALQNIALQHTQETVNTDVTSQPEEQFNQKPQSNVVIQKLITPQSNVVVQKPITSTQTQQFWKCPKCGTTNFAERIECYNCHTKIKIKT